MSNVTTSLNRHYVKNGRYVVQQLLADKVVFLGEFSRKKDAVSFCRQKFYEKVFYFFYPQEEFRSFSLPDGYQILDSVLEGHVADFSLYYDVLCCEYIVFQVVFVPFSITSSVFVSSFFSQAFLDSSFELHLRNLRRLFDIRFNAYTRYDS